MKALAVLTVFVLLFLLAGLPIGPVEAVAVVAPTATVSTTPCPTTGGTVKIKPGVTLRVRDFPVTGNVQQVNGKERVLTEKDGILNVVVEPSSCWFLLAQADTLPGYFSNNPSYVALIATPTVQPTPTKITIPGAATSTPRPTNTPTATNLPEITATPTPCTRYLLTANGQINVRSTPIVATGNVAQTMNKGETIQADELWKAGSKVGTVVLTADWYHTLTDAYISASVVTAVCLPMPTQTITPSPTATPTALTPRPTATPLIIHFVCPKACEGDVVIQELP